GAAGTGALTAAGGQSERGRGGRRSQHEGSPVVHGLLLVENRRPLRTAVVSGRSSAAARPPCPAEPGRRSGRRPRRGAGGPAAPGPEPRPGPTSRTVPTGSPA